MEIINVSYPSVVPQAKTPIVMAIGFFDGVHLGHQKVIQTAKKMAKRLGHSLAVMTFYPHPKEVLQKDTLLRYLTPLDAKLHLFRTLGVEKSYVMQFDRVLSGLSPEEFVEKILLPFQVKGVVTGVDFLFGKNQAGSIKDLRQLSKGIFEFETVEDVRKDQHRVSSTWIRQLLANGKIDLATQLLGRYYRFEGGVEEGDGRGSLIGFPTANVNVTDPFCLPKRGVYIVRVLFEYPAFEYITVYGMMNIGIRPTFKDDDAPEKVEVHLFDFDSGIDLYGRGLSIEVLHELRPEQRFSSADALVEQLKKDEQQSKKWLQAASLFT